MEGVAYSLKDCMQVLEGLEIPMDETFRIIGGGSKSALWRQIVSDVLDRPLRRVRSDDSSIGSAMLAGVVSGVFGSWIEAVEVCSQMEDVVYPNKENRAVYEENFAIYKEIQQAMEKIYSHW
jgi:xylulokinase